MLAAAKLFLDRLSQTVSCCIAANGELSERHLDPHKLIH